MLTVAGTSVPAVAGSAPRSGARRYVLIFLTLLTVSLGFNAIAVAKLPGITPIDGAVYLDAFQRGGRGEVTVRGDTLGPQALDVLACRGMYGFEALGMTCLPDGHAADDRFRQELAATPVTSYVHPPTYFVITGVAARALVAVLPGHPDPLALARLLGAVWFSLGALLLVRVAALWGASPWAATAVVAAFVPTPTFLMLYSFITPDAMGLLVSAAALLGATMWWHGRMPAWPLLIFGAATTGAVKQTYLPAALAAALLLAALWGWRRHHGGGEGRTGAATAAAVGWLLTGAALGLLGWFGLRELLARAPFIELPSDPFAGPVTLDKLLGLIAVGARSIPVEAAGAYPPTPATVVATAALLTLVTAAAAGGALLSGDRCRGPIAAAGVTAIITGGLVVSVLYAVTNGLLLPASPRYVVGAWPLYVLPLLLVRRRWVTGLMIALTVVGVTAWLLWPVHPATG